VNPLADRRVDQAAAGAVAAAYAGARARLDPLTRAAYAQLATESDRLFGLITSPDEPDPVRVRFTTCPLPYRDASELIASVTGDRLLEVTTVAADRHRRHPLLDSTRGGEYDRFRAVHDVLGHAGLRLGFDRHGEFAVWLYQERFHGPGRPPGARHRAPRPAQRLLDDGPHGRAQGGPARSRSPAPQPPVPPLGPQCQAAGTSCSHNRQAVTLSAAQQGRG